MPTTKTLDKLLNDSPELMTCAYGKAGRIALALKGDPAKVTLMYDLISNYHGSCILHRLSPDLSYVSLTPASLRAAIQLFLYVNILHSKEAGSYETWDEETGVYTLSQDTAAAEALSARDAAAFVAAIPVKSFIPSDYSTPSHEYQFAARA